MAGILFPGWLVLALAMYASQASAVAPDAVSPELADWYAQADAAMVSRARELAGAEGGRSKLAAVHLLRRPLQRGAVGTPDVARDALGDRWLSEVEAESPDDPLLAWLRATCSPLVARGSCGSERDDGLERLRVVASERALTHLMLAQRAADAGDREGERAHFEVAASAPRFGSFDQEHLQVIAMAFEGLELPALPASLRGELARDLGTTSGLEPRDIGDLFAAQQLALLALPAYQYPLNQCGISGDPGTRTDERHEACLRLFQRMADDAHNVLQDLIALGALVQLDDGTAQGATWRERLRETAWLVEQYMQASSEGRLEDPALIATHMAAWTAHGEGEAMRRSLATLGIAGTPPAGWLPAEPQRRHLVEFGERLPR